MKMIKYQVVDKENRKPYKVACEMEGYEKGTFLEFRTHREASEAIYALSIKNADIVEVVTE